MPQLVISPLSGPSPAAAPVEIVERKGTGHPDTICDALAEELSLALCRFYLDRFGIIFHHNVDKALLWGGASRPAFGGGEVVEPIEIFLAGRATLDVRGIKVPIEELVLQTGRRWLAEHFHALDPAGHVKLHPLVRPGSSDLVALYLRQEKTGVALANDTSCGVGYAPLDTLEHIVLAVERHLNAKAVKSAHPEIGEDIKVMGIRDGGGVRLTVACAFVDAHVTDADDYLAKKARVGQLAHETAAGLTSDEVQVEVNTGDAPQTGNLYLTVTGTSAEAGDDGEVGRGNRVNGLITPYRPMNMEAAAGKNPVTHVGKLYNIVAGQIAAALVRELAGVEEAHCHLVSQIGQPIQEPGVIDLRLRMHPDADQRAVELHAGEIAWELLTNIGAVQDALLARAISVY
jgi:S-adenosylmethionine synthetase